MLVYFYTVILAMSLLWTSSPRSHGILFFWVFVFCKRQWPYVPLPCVVVLLKKPQFLPVKTQDWGNGVLSSMLTMFGSSQKVPCASSLYSCSSFVHCFLYLDLPLFPCICPCFLPWPLSLLMFSFDPSQGCGAQKEHCGLCLYFKQSSCNWPHWAT